jgi:spermidine synthase
LTIAALVFIAGAIVMMLELAGARLLAPYFGNSLFVWTSLIGVMLGFMSLGYYLGGRLADARLDAGNLFWILMGSGISVALVTFSEAALLPALSRGDSLRLLAVISATILFAVPSTLLGMVSPYCIRLRMHAVEDSGATVGSLYAISTLGSIVGTFAAGFWLISLFGTHDLIMLLALALGLLSLLVVRWVPAIWKRLVAFGVLGLLLALSAAGVAAGAETIDTPYDRYFLREVVDPRTGEPMIALSRDNLGAESAAYLETREPYAFDYYGYYDLAPAIAGGADHTLLIGGGTFSYPRLFVAKHPEARMDVVEIDPALDELARSEFGYVDDPRISLHFEDGRTFLNRATGPYDAVFMDAFKSEATVPYQLTTRETWQRCFDVLDAEGVVVMNVIASPTDARAPFFDALFATISEVFPEVRAYRVQLEDDPTAIQNTMIVAAKNPAVDIEAAVRTASPEAADKLLEGFVPPAGTRILTDDHAPVDQLLLGF